MLAGFKAAPSHFSTSASVVDGKLILSMPDAITPVVWQMDLKETQSSAFEVAAAEGQNFSLVSRKGGSKTSDVIAVFSSQQAAVGALMATARALENNRAINYVKETAGSYAPSYAPSHHPAPRSKGAGSWLTWILAAIGVVFLIFLLSAMIMMRPTPIELAASGATAASSSESDAGVPVSADDFLRQQ